MSKSILVIDTPETCEQCPCCVHIIGKKYCAARGVHLGRDGRENCPLVEVPEPVDPAKAKCTSEASRIDGWNACVSKILVQET